MNDADRRNRQEWDRLYRDADARIWGERPPDFLLEDLDHALSVLDGPVRLLLDAGTGEGRNLQLLGERADAVIACDASAFALGRISEPRGTKVHPVGTDLSSLPFAASTFDAVACIDVIETLPDPGAVLRELHRVLRPDGVLVCNIPGEEDPIAGVEMQPVDGGGYLYRGRFFYRFMGEDEGRTMLEEAGFRVEWVRERSWLEDEHPDYRAGAHRHVSRVWTVRASHPSGSPP